MSDIPLICDLDESLINTDSLWESFVRGLSANPLIIFLIPLWLVKGRSYLKYKLSSYPLDYELLPKNEETIKLLEEAKKSGRRVGIASAASEEIVDNIAKLYGFFDFVFASSQEVNLKGRAKAQKLVAEFGEKGFDYIGDAKADIAIWKKSRKAIVVGSDAFVKKVKQSGIKDILHIEKKAPSLKTYLKAFRIHQWVKNILIFVPLFLSHQISFYNFLMAGTAFLSFSLSASATYLLNDLVDLNSDRKHPTKKLRPFASGELSIPKGIFAGVSIFILSMCLGLFILPRDFFLVLLFYLVVTITYSFFFKKILFLDVAVLSMLYVLRIIAGTFAISVFLSNWLLGFSFFAFLGLALMKRWAELHTMQNKGEDHVLGRAYKTSDMPIVATMAVCSVFCSLSVFILYIDSITALRQYKSPEILWVLTPVITYLLGRLLIITHRGEMKDDPVEFVVKDKISIAMLALCLLVVALAH